MKGFKQKTEHLSPGKPLPTVRALSSTIAHLLKPNTDYTTNKSLLQLHPSSSSASRLRLTIHNIGATISS